MLFTVDTKTLLGKVRNAALLCKAKVVQPVLKCVHIYADNTPEPDAGLYSTDLDNWLHQDIPVDRIIEAGEVLVDARQLLDALKAMSGKEVTLCTQGDGLTLNIRSEATTVSLTTLDAADYPRMPARAGDLICGLRNDDLRKIIDRAVWAASQNGGSSILNGVDVQVKSAQLNVCATDGSRLTHIQASPMLSQGDQRALIPASSFAILDKAFDWKTNNSIELIKSDSNQVTWRWRGGHLTVRTISGYYPRYVELFPGNQPITMIFKRSELLAASKSFCAQKTRTNVIKFSCSGMAKLTSSEISLELTISVDGNHMAVINAKHMDKQEPFVFALDCFYLKDICESDKSEYVRLTAQTPLKPFVFHWDDGIGRHLLMPAQAK